MYCRNCGEPMQENAAVCIHCGCARDVGRNFCPNCGNAVKPGAAVCLQCGMALEDVLPSGKVEQKSKLAAGLFGIFLGWLGIHNFYLGYTKKGILQLLLGTAGWFLCLAPGVAAVVWGLVDGIMILSGSINKDANGIPLKE